MSPKFFWKSEDLFGPGFRVSNGHSTPSQRLAARAEDAHTLSRSGVQRLAVPSLGEGS